MTDRAAARSTGRLSGDDLIGEVLHNMEDGLFRIRRKTIVPAIYRIYLSPADYEPFRDVVPFIAGEIRAALDERLARWNGSKLNAARAFLGKLGVGEVAEPSEYVRVAEGWTSKFIRIWMKSCSGAKLRFIPIWAPRRSPSMGGDL